jgi:hypothetical protein
VTVPHVRRWLPIAVYILVPSILILPILFSGRMLFGSDVVNLFNYTRIFIAESFRSGNLPTWDPRTMAGVPLLAGVQGAVFYPQTWLCVFFSAGTFWTLSVGLHLFLTGLFAHRWLERGLRVDPWSALVGGAVCLLSGYLANRVFLGHVNYVWAYPWVPAVLWRFERFLSGPGLKRGVLLAGAFAMMVLAGVPQYVLFVGVLLTARSAQALYRDRACVGAILRGLGWLVLGLLACAPQVLPTLELASQMQRGNAQDRAFYEAGSMELGFIQSLCWGQTFGEACAHVGIAAVLLALASLVWRRDQTLLWAGLALFGLLMALGPGTPLYGILTTLVPGAGQFRAPGRYLLLFTVGMTALVALGFEALWTKDTRVYRGLAAVLAAAAVLQLIALNHFFYQRWEEGRNQWPVEVSQHLRKSCGLEHRVASAGSSASIVDVGRCGEIGVDHVGGYDPMMLRRYAELINALRGAPLGANMPLLAAEAPHPAMDMLGAKVWHFESGKPDGSWPRWMKTDFYENPGALPRAWLVNNAVVLESAEERLKTIAKGRWDPRKTVILESYPTDAPPVPTEKAAGKARVVSKRPGSYEIEAENDADAYLVLSEAYYPGWRAEVDGQAVDVLPANHLIQTIRLPAGKHVVRFEYRSRFLGLGFAVAALAALVPVGLLVRRHRRQLPLERLPGAP